MYFKSFYRLLKSSNKSKYSSLTVSSIHPEDFGKHWYVNFFSRAQAPSICWPSSIYAPPLSLHSVGFHHFQWRARHVNLSITTMNISHGHNSVHKYVSHCYFLSFYVLTNIFNSPLWLDNGERLRLECQNNHTLEHTYFILKRWSEQEVDTFFFFFFLMLLVSGCCGVMILTGNKYSFILQQPRVRIAFVGVWMWECVSERRPLFSLNVRSQVWMGGRGRVMGR